LKDGSSDFTTIGPGLGFVHRHQNHEARLVGRNDANKRSDPTAGRIATVQVKLLRSAGFPSDAHPFDLRAPAGSLFVHDLFQQPDETVGSVSPHYLPHPLGTIRYHDLALSVEHLAH